MASIYCNEDFILYIASYILYYYVGTYILYLQYYTHIRLIVCFFFSTTKYVIIVKYMFFFNYKFFFLQIYQ